jgi:hypothetical protein
MRKKPHSSCELTLQSKPREFSSTPRISPRWSIYLMVVAVHENILRQSRVQEKAQGPPTLYPAPKPWNPSFGRLPPRHRCTDKSRRECTPLEFVHEQVHCPIVHNSKLTPWSMAGCYCYHHYAGHHDRNENYDKNHEHPAGSQIHAM